MSTMKTVTTREAQHHLSKVLKLVDAGEEVVITRRGKELAKLSPIDGGTTSARRVDWGESIRRCHERLGNIPALSENLVVELREEERS